MKSLYTCDDHDDCIVLHEKFSCPLCAALDSLIIAEDDLENCRKDLQEEIDILKDERRELRRERK